MIYTKLATLVLKRSRFFGHAGLIRVDNYADLGSGLPLLTGVFPIQVWPEQLIYPNDPAAWGVYSIMLQTWSEAILEYLKSCVIVLQLAKAEESKVAGKTSQMLHTLCRTETLLEALLGT